MLIQFIKCRMQLSIGEFSQRLRSSLMEKVSIRHGENFESTHYLHPEEVGEDIRVFGWHFAKLTSNWLGH